MGIPSSQIDRTIRAMALSNIKESAKIWHFHSTGTMVRFGNRVQPDSAFNLERGLQDPIIDPKAPTIDDLQIPDTTIESAHRPVFDFSVDELLSLLDEDEDSD